MKLFYIILLMTISLSGFMTFPVIDFNVEGKWSDYVAVPKGTFRMEENTTAIDFTKDTFYYSNQRTTDYFSGDTCQVDRGNEFASGKYSIDDNFLYLNGSWTDNTYKK